MTASAVADFRDLDHRGYEFKREHFARVARSFGNSRSTNLLNLMHRARTPLNQRLPSPPDRRNHGGCASWLPAKPYALLATPYFRVL
jgi:hypothetical protein